MWHNENHIWIQIKRFGVRISMLTLLLASLLLYFQHIIQFMLILILFDLLAFFTTLCFSLSDLLNQRIPIILNIIKLLHSLYFWFILIIVLIYRKTLCPVSSIKIGLTPVFRGDWTKGFTVLFLVHLLETYRSYLLKFVCYFTVFCELSKRVGGGIFWVNKIFYTPSPTGGGVWEGTTSKQILCIL